MTDLHFAVRAAALWVSAQIVTNRGKESYFNLFCFNLGLRQRNPSGMRAIPTEARLFNSIKEFSGFL
ncbi:MAG: hypothetical protein P4M05_10635 [Bradyrhizobium sp.]|nr:hypothetical protein [Bradyrhizobium sp.]